MSIDLENSTFKVVNHEESDFKEKQGFVFEEPIKNIDVPKTVTENEVVPEDYVLDNEKVVRYLKDTLDLDIDDLSSLTKKEERELPEDIKAYLKYREDTGRSFQDFVESQKDWDSENDDVLMKKYVSEKNPFFDKDDVDSEIEEKYSFDEEYDSESDIKKITREKKRILAEAKTYLKEQNEKYKIPLESNDDYIPEEYKDAKQRLQEINETRDLVSQTEEKAVNYFREQTEELFSKDFKGFDFKIENEDLVYKPSNVEESKNSQMSIGNFIDKYIGDDGLIKDVKGYHKALNMAMNPDSVAKHFYELGKSKAIEDIAKDRKNIDSGFSKTNDSNNNTTTFRVLNPDVQQTFR